MILRRATPIICAAAAAFAALSAPAQAAPEGPGWELSATTYPTNLVQSVDEVQEVAASSESGTFTVSYEGAETKSPLPVHATDSEVQAALEALSTIGTGNVAVTGTIPGQYSVEFINVLGNMKTAELAATGATTTVKAQGHASGGTIGIDVVNIGAAESHGTVTVTDTLPPGIKAKEAGALITPGLFSEDFGIAPLIEQGLWTCAGNGAGGPPHIVGATILTCTNSTARLSRIPGGGGTPTFGGEENHPQPAVGILVEAEQGTKEGTKQGIDGNHVTVAGGGALEPASTVEPVTLSKVPASGGLTQADAWLSNPDGTVDRQAGSHPYEATFIFTEATAIDANNKAYLPGGDIRNLETRVPPGLIGDLHNTTQCTRAQLFTESCPPASMVGRLKVQTFETTIGEQVYNMVPAPGTPAELGFNYSNVPVYITFSVNTGGDYGIVAHVNNIPQREAYQSILTLWGVPADSSHNIWRHGESGCSQKEMESPPLNGLAINYCAPQAGSVLTPILRLPTSCADPQLTPQLFAFREINGWQQPNASSEVPVVAHDASGKPAGFTGCEALGSEPAFTAVPETGRSDTPTGLTVDVKPPLGGSELPHNLASADIQNAKVTLPEGLVINPGQAAGLQACGTSEAALTSEAEKASGHENDGPASCPPGSKIGTATIKSPLIEGDTEKQFEGNVYVLPSNPPEVKLLVAASADGVDVKLVGVAHLNEQTGRVETTFAGTPQLPFSDFKLTFEGGAKAALATPTQCATYTSDAVFTPWSSPFAADFLTNASFAIVEGPNGSACPSGPLPFTPTLTAGTTSTEAGAFTSFSMHLQRADGQQRIERLQFRSPAGLAALISSVPRCDEANANAGTCPLVSRIGHAVVTSGPGGNPLVLPQPGGPALPIYLTGPYKGAPFGLSIVTPVVAGPFTLGTIVTRARIEVDPATAQVTVTTDPLPQIVKGVPTDLRSIDAVIDRPGFFFNPTNCNPQEFTGTATSAGGATAPLTSRFQVGGCRGLEFHPRFSVSTAHQASKAGGASLDVNVTSHGGPQPGGGEANIRSVKVDLPKQLPSRLTTLQKACLASVFEANPASCPKESDVGSASARTPVLANPLTGPAYLVSHGGAAFPDLEIVLQGEGITLVLDGHTDIKHGVTSSTFSTVPDAPISSFELKLPTGRFSVLGAYLPSRANYGFCGQRLSLPTMITAQNGAVIHQTTSLGVTGCPKARRATRAQKLASALRTCHRSGGGRRRGCELQARRNYGPPGRKR